MGKNAKRKPRPSIPNYLLLDRDGCWFCKNRKNCNSCGVNRQDVGESKRKRIKRMRKVDIRKEETD